MLIKREFAMDESWIHHSDPESKEMWKEWKHVGFGFKNSGREGLLETTKQNFELKLWKYVGKNLLKVPCFSKTTHLLVVLQIFNNSILYTKVEKFMIIQ
jgi:hypothetical protein